MSDQTHGRRLFMMAVIDLMPVKVMISLILEILAVTALWRNVRIIMSMQLDMYIQIRLRLYCLSAFRNS